MSHPPDAGRTPWWVTLADALALGLAGLALLVGIGGGYRVRVAGVLVSVTSPFRLLVWAAVVAAARHMAVPSPNVVRRLRTFASRIVAGVRRALHASPGSAPGTRRPVWVELTAVSGVMIALTIVKLYPFARHLDWVPEFGDPLFSVWRIGWVAHQLPRDPLHLYDANIFWPERYALAYGDGMPLTGVAAAPLIWLGAPPAVVYNVFVLASFVLCGLAMYLLVRSLVGSVVPAAVAAVAFAFAPFRFEHLIHIELLSAFWMPLALWALHKTLTEPHRRWRMGLLTGAAVAAQFLSGMYFGVFLAAFTVVVWVCLSLARKLRGAAVGPLLLGALLAGVLILPSLPPYAHVRSAIGERSREEVRVYSATPADYLAVQHPGRRMAGCNERQVFPGFLVVGLALAALWPPLSAVRAAYLLGLLFAFDVSLGSNGVLHPYLYEWVLPFRGLRVPARCAMLVGLSLAVLAGFGTARLAGLVRHRRGQVCLLTVLCGVILAEPRPTRGITPLPRVPSVYAWFEGRPVSAIVEFPVRDPFADRYLFCSTTHWQRMVNGYSGSLPASYRSFQTAMREFPDEAALSALRTSGVSYAVIHEEFYGTAAYREVIRQVEQSPSLAPINTAADGGFEARIYQVLR